MYPLYGNVHPHPPNYHPPHPYHPPPFANATPGHAVIPAPIPDELTKKRYEESDKRLHNALSRIHFPTPEHKQECSALVKRLRLCRHLFLHTYVHLVSCSKGGYLHVLVEHARTWTRWSSVEQLAHHSTVKGRLLDFWTEYTCHDHKSLRKQNFEIHDDESDLLCLLLYCAKKEELYELCKKPAVQGVRESDRIIELLWEFLRKSQKSHDVHRLHASIYRMARKSAYLPHALQIAHPSVSNRRDFARGGNGIVDRATMNGHHVVIKKIPCRDYAHRRECLEVFASEAILWSTLDHKNIVPFWGVVMESTFDMGLVSPFFRNGNIRDYLDKCKPQQLHTIARKLAKGLAKGLEYIHSHDPPIIHGDLKGDNVLVDDGGNACLGDFGQSYASDSAKYLDSTRVGLVRSPVYWTAPELLLGGDRAKATAKSDVYSFGCVVYEMVSGQFPFEGIPPLDVLGYVQHGRHPNKPASISPDDILWKVIMSCWDRPDSRPSANRLVSSLR